MEQDYYFDEIEDIESDNLYDENEEEELSLYNCPECSSSNTKKICCGNSVCLDCGKRFDPYSNID